MKLRSLKTSFQAWRSWLIQLSGLSGADGLRAGSDWFSGFPSVFVYRAVRSINRPHVVAGSRVEKVSGDPPYADLCMFASGESNHSKQTAASRACFHCENVFFLHLSFQSLTPVRSETPDGYQFAVTTGSDRVRH